MPKLKKKSIDQKNKDRKIRNRLNRLDPDFRKKSNVINSLCRNKQLLNKQNHETHKKRLILSQVKN